MNLSAHANEWILVAFILAVTSLFLNKIMARFFKNIGDDNKKEGILKIASLVSSLCFLSAVLIVGFFFFGNKLP